MEWKILEENDKYEVSNTGIVRRIDTQHTLSGCLASGYRSVKLTYENSKQKRFYIHRLVAKYFVNNPDPKNKTVVNHIDGNKINNNADNLEWVTPRENNLHYYQLNQQAKKERKFHEAIPVEQYSLKGELLNTFPSLSQAHKITGVSVVQIARCVHDEIQQANGFIWKIGSTTK